MAAIAPVLEREVILDALASFAAQRPGLDPRNYISHGRDDAGRAAYRAEVRSITKDLHQARTLLAQVRWRNTITADNLKDAMRRAFSGRLSWQQESVCERCGELFWSNDTQHPGATGACECTRTGQHATRALTGRGRLDYCTGQYWPTEYRRAVCAVLASALWEYWRETMPAPTYKHYGSATDHPMQTVALYDGLRAGDWLRRTARRELGRAIAKRWFA